MQVDLFFHGKIEKREEKKYSSNPRKARGQGGLNWKRCYPDHSSSTKFNINDYVKVTTYNESGPHDSETHQIIVGPHHPNCMYVCLHAYISPFFASGPLVSIFFYPVISGIHNSLLFGVNIQYFWNIVGLKSG